jgi:hypothetical protein
MPLDVSLELFDLVCKLLNLFGYNKECNFFELRKQKIIGALFGRCRRRHLNPKLRQFSHHPPPQMALSV